MVSIVWTLVIHINNNQGFFDKYSGEDLFIILPTFLVMSDFRFLVVMMIVTDGGRCDDTYKVIHCSQRNVATFWSVPFCTMNIILEVVISPIKDFYRGIDQDEIWLLFLFLFEIDGLCCWTIS